MKTTLVRANPPYTDHDFQLISKEIIIDDAINSKHIFYFIVYLHIAHYLFTYLLLHIYILHIYY